MPKASTICFAFLILFWHPAAAQTQTAFTIGYDLYTLQRALEAKSESIEYDQDSSGLMFAAESVLSPDGSIIFEYRDAGKGSIRCTSAGGVVEIDGEDYVCSGSGFESKTEASSYSLAYKIYNSRQGYWKFGLGSYRIVYHDTDIPEKSDTNLYIGWGLPIDVNSDREGL